MTHTANSSPAGPTARALAVVVAASALLASETAHADDTIRRPGDHPSYAVEVEPHAVFGWGGIYAPGGFGLGARFSIPIVSNGFVPTINNSVGVTFGLDWVHYGQCWYAGNCTADYFDVPIAMQWNFFVARRFSVFGEPGAVIYFGSFPGCPLQSNLCPSRPPTVGVEPALFIGGRYHLNDQVALTVRLGFPAFSFGVSFFP
ncbi:MAG TPA: hypothetical protein VGM06_20420 [Polyangiaceae bacterium]|jgi:hypothetical protein